MRRILFLATLVVAVSTAAGQASRVDETLSVRSALLGRDVRYAVYLPPGYATSVRSFPVLYLLHGGGDDHTGWVQFGEVQQIADAAIATGAATPMVIVMPDASEPPRGYFNSPDGASRYEDFFFDEFIPAVESTFRIRAEKRYRAVSGLSMGGGGTFMYALHRPDLFSSAAPLSASTGPLSVDEFRRRAGESLTGLSEAQVEAYVGRHSAVELVKVVPDDRKQAVRWYIDCGDDDFLFEGNALVHIEMRKAGIPHEYRVRDGGHTWTYWRESLPDVLAFVSAGFHQF